MGDAAAQPLHPLLQSPAAANPGAHLQHLLSEPVRNVTMGQSEVQLPQQAFITLQNDSLPCCCVSNSLHVILELLDQARHVHQRVILLLGGTSILPCDALLSYVCICPTIYQQRPPTSTSSSSAPTSSHVNALIFCSNIIMHAKKHGSALTQAQCCGQAHRCTAFGLHLSTRNKQACECNLIQHRVLHYFILY